MELHKPSLDELELVALAWEKVLAVKPNVFREQTLKDIRSNPEIYLESIDGALDGTLLRLEDGSEVAKLPMITRYMWVDGQPAGAISYRWQPGTTDLPSHVLGHIGYETFPWFQRHGYATSALAQILQYPREQGMPFVEIVTNVDNYASQKVVANNGGVLKEEFEKPASSGGGKALRYLIAFSA